MSRNISSEEAEGQYKITSEHEKMDNGELRFRLKKSDGSAYIRTESPATSRPEDGWQNAHYHNKFKETYIVQSGWMVYAELFEDRPRYYKYSAGELFTTPPNVIHNVYLPPGAVIHTVKHGEATGESRLVDEKTGKFTRQTKKNVGDNLRAIAVHPNTKTREDSDSFYNIAYRHFDNLIWQVPAWSTAIFAVVLAGMAKLTVDGALMTFVGVPVETFFAISYGVFGFFIFVLSYALFRFRWHQIRNKVYTPKHHLISPQVYLQALINVQAFTLLLLSLKGFGVKPSYILGVLLVLYLLLTVAEERYLIKEGGGKPESTTS